MMKISYLAAYSLAFSSSSTASFANAAAVAANNNNKEKEGEEKPGNLRQLPEKYVLPSGGSHDNLGVTTPCNGNGNNFFTSEINVLGFYGMTPECVCFDCYSGPNCEIKDDIKTCHVEADSVELSIVKSVLPFTQMSFSNQFRIRYQSFRGIGNTTQLTYAISESIKDLHTAVGNVNFENHELIVGVGGHQLIQAALYALSPNRAKTTSVYAAPPFWSKFPRMINGYSPTNQFVPDYDEAMDIVANGGDIIDLITSPSNSGNLLANEQQLIPVPSSKQIWDLVYYWPSCYANKTAITPMAEDIMIFSLSKLCGYSGHRFGWMWMKGKTLFSFIVIP